MVLCTCNVQVPWTCCVLKSGTSPNKATEEDVADVGLCRIDALLPDRFDSNFLHSQVCIMKTIECKLDKYALRFISPHHKHGVLIH